MRARYARPSRGVNGARRGAPPLVAVIRCDAMLDRHALDRLARAVVSGRRGNGPAFDRLADRVAGLMRSRLGAAGAPGVRRAVRRTVSLDAAARAVGGRDTLAALIRRIDKHLAPLAEALVARADAR